MEIQWLGHACFAVESEGWRIVLDPYEVEGYPALHTEGDEVLCSHGHHDHNHVAAVTLRGSGRQSPFTVERVATFHDEVQGAKRGANTIHILSAEGLRVTHFGDLGHWPTEEQFARLRGCDAVLIPVGGFYTIDAAMAKRICDELKPRVIVPMHYRDGERGLRVVAPVEEFLSLCEPAAVTRLDTDRFTLTADAPRGVIVPAFLG